VTDASSLGSTIGPTLVANGATLDLGGNSVVNNLNLGPEQINIRGNGVGGNGALVNTGVAQQNALQRVTLLENGTVGGTARFDVRATDGMLDLGGFTLTKTGPNQFTIVNATVTDGNIVVNQGILAIEAGSTVEDFGTGKTITYNNGTTAQFFQNAGLVTSHDFQWQRIQAGMPATLSRRSGAIPHSTAT
jgi:hypothetical protein